MTSAGFERNQNFVKYIARTFEYTYIIMTLKIIFQLATLFKIINLSFVHIFEILIICLQTGVLLFCHCIITYSLRLCFRINMRIYLFTRKKESIFWNDMPCLSRIDVKLKLNMLQNSGKCNICTSNIVTCFIMNEKNDHSGMQLPYSKILKYEQ